MLATSIGSHDLAATGAQLRALAPWQLAGHGATTLVRTPDLRIVLIELREGAQLVEHRSVAPVSIHTVRGRIRLHVGDDTLLLPAGQLVTLDGGVAHSVEADEDSTILVTIAWKADA